MEFLIIFLWILPTLLAFYFTRKLIKIEIEKYGELEIDKDAIGYIIVGIIFCLIPIFNFVVMIFTIGVLFDGNYDSKFVGRIVRRIFLIRGKK